MKRIFILGNPRSGTSLFRLMLNQHSEIVAPPECGFLQWWYNKYKDWTAKDNFSKRLDLFLEDIFTSKKIETWELNRNLLRKYILTKNPQNYGDLAECVYLTYDSHPENIRVIADKNNYYINHIPELKNIWPDALFIHLIRDGRDVACSYLDVNKLQTNSPYKPQLPKSVEQIAKEWTKNNFKISQLKEDNSEKYLLVRYEDVVLNTQKTLTKVCNFFDLDFELGMLEYYKLSGAKKPEPLQTLDWKKKTLEQPDQNKINRYKIDLTEEQIYLFNKIASTELDYYGYKS